MMNRSIVMTSEPSTMAIRGKRDRPVPIGSEDSDAMPRQPLQHVGRGVAVRVPPAYADHRVVGSELVQPLVGRGARGPVMTHLQQVHRAHRARQPRLDRGAGTAVDHHPATVWGSQHNCIPLPHIKKKYGKTTANVEPDDVS